jgi:hypothetical protein
VAYQARFHESHEVVFDAWGRRWAGRMFACSMDGQRVMELGSRPSSSLTLRMAMRLCWVIISSRGGSGSRTTSDVNMLIDLMPKSAEMVVHMPPLDCSRSINKIWRALLWRSCRSLDIEGQLPAMRPLLLNCPHIGHLRVLFHVRSRVSCIPHINSILCVNSLDLREAGCRRCSVESAPRDWVVAIGGRVWWYV